MAGRSSSDILALRQEVDEARARADLAEAEAARAKAIAADAEARNALLELQIEKMRRAHYGQRSEHRQHLIDQMELGLEEAEASAGEDEALAAAAAAKISVEAFTRARPTRRAFPDHLP
ncbi:transposase, partial [Rhizorhapis sp. SPR117]|uniref:transposase n=1 Tax=Rhizorhapis sp. SPR117 TaxID=2912611 RepID=UPI001F24A4DA|nr:transposase [Rhizorhapis sp. SPR117]